jgi:hypothetical protein
MLAPKRLSDNTVYLVVRRRADRLLVAVKGSVATLLSDPVPQAVKLKTKGEQNIKTELIIYALAALTVSDRTQAQSQAGNAVPVTPDNFIRAESDRYFGRWLRMEVSANSPITAN